jgi:hypothetical protein
MQQQEDVPRGQAVLVCFSGNEDQEFGVVAGTTGTAAEKLTWVLLQNSECFSQQLLV